MSAAGTRSPAASEATPEHHDGGASFWIGLAVGSAIMAYGMWWLFDNAGFTDPPGWTLFLVGFAVIHDLVVVALYAVVGWLVRRVLPGWTRAWVTGGLIVSGVLALYAYPAITDYGNRPSNATLLPYNYATNLAIVLGIVWAVVAVGLVLAHRARGSSRASRA